MGWEHIAFIGKNGVGKSTTAANVSAALAEAGHRVALIRYDSRWDLAPNLGAGEALPVPGWQGIASPPCYSYGFQGMLTIEAGDLDGTGATAEVDRVLDIPLIRDNVPTFVVHDIASEQVADALLPAAALRQARIFLVTTADVAGISAANRYLSRLRDTCEDSISFGGLIINNLPGPLHESMAADYAQQADAVVVASIPHSVFVSVSDYYHQPLVQSAPFSHNSFIYRKLARYVERGCSSHRPGFLAPEQLRNWAEKWSDIITELETGEVRDGAGI